MILTRKFGTLEGCDVIEATLRSDTAEVAILNYGCVVRDWRVRTKTGVIPVVLGFDGFDYYPDHSPSFGIIAGRVANRTAKGMFHLNGVDYHLPINNGENHLHGGPIGLGRRIWVMETDDRTNSIHLRYHSKNGEEGYPAAVDFTVTFQLQGNRLTCEMTGNPDAPTPVNLAQHSYYNLNGYGNTRDHLVQIAAQNYTPVDDAQIPTGEILPVKNTRFNFTSATSFGRNDHDNLGVDHNLVLDAGRNPKDPAAIVYSPSSNLELQLWTEEPGLQLFNAPGMNLPVPGLHGENYGPFAGLCLEAQHFPDSLNRPEWPSIICTPTAPYLQKLVVEIAPR